MLGRLVGYGTWRGFGGREVCSRLCRVVDGVCLPGFVQILQAEVLSLGSISRVKLDVASDAVYEGFGRGDSLWRRLWGA